MARESTNGGGSHGLDHHRGGSGEPLVLIHGIGHTWRGWKPMLPELERRFDVLAVDLPGFGHSEPLPAGLDSTPEALADAVEREMIGAGFDTAHISGNSLGGWVAFELARRGRARTVTAISPAGLQHGREKQWGAGILRGMRWLAQNAPPPEAALRNPVTRSLLAGPATARPWRYDPDLLIESTEIFAENPGFDATLPHTFHAQPRGLTTLDVPVLILWGKLDLILLPRQGRRFERLIPGAELRYISGAGHVPMTDVPELLAESIAEFALDRRGGLVDQDRDTVAHDL
ncbi:MAG TPA: alpha/beta hydrolase [Thermoleophilaceae bacterium]|nr:alpha/beta hydrolase [Thermoleophilaceae bacterium]